MSDRDAQRRLDALARRQHGVIARPQLLELGITDSMIRRRVESGAWIRVEPGVFALASHPASWARQVMAATLTIDGAVAAGRTAAALHGLDGYGRTTVEIAVPPGRNARTRLASVRHSAFLDHTVIDGIPVLTPVHTVLSLAPLVDRDRLEQAVDHVLVTRAVDLRALAAAAAAFSAARRPGSRALRAILAMRRDDQEPVSTSELERVLRRVLRRPGVPRFAFEVPMPWWPRGQGRVDAYRAAARLIVEADGRRWHTRERDFVADRRRDNRAAAHGHAVLRFTWDDLTGRADECVALILDTIAERSRRAIEG